jgi:hypothetical protein
MMRMVGGGVGGSLAAALFVEIGHGAGGFAVHRFALEVFALIPLGFAFTDADFDFHSGTLPVGPQSRQSETLLLGECGEFADLTLVQ